jgi:transposase
MHHNNSFPVRFVDGIGVSSRLPFLRKILCPRRTREPSMECSMQQPMVMPMMSPRVVSGYIIGYCVLAGIVFEKVGLQF